MDKAIKVISQRFPRNTDDDWCRPCAVLLHLNYGEELLALLRERGDDAAVTAMVRSALRVAPGRSPRHLENIPIEVRTTAEYYFDQIEKRWNALPEKTSRRAAPKPAKKRRKA